MSEPFDIKKLLSAPFTGLYWVKVVAIGCGIFVVVFVGYGLWKAYIKKPLPTTDQHADTIVNHYYEPKTGMFGCISMKAYQYGQEKALTNSTSP
jgi:hypothetical protein